MSAPEPKKLHVDKYERSWLIATGIMLVIFVILVTVAGSAMGIAFPAPQNRVDPNTVDKEGPFANPGLREISPGKYEAYILAQIWQFKPRELSVPVGAKVTFYVTSKDVQHGFRIEGTNMNAQIVPGHVSKMTVTFAKAGTFNFICHEYCGTGHVAMFGTITVTP
jgi:cytochrome c oxidase subunit 2